MSIRRTANGRELQSLCDRYRAEGHTIGFVPTMGALHAGHLSLIDAVRAQGATRTVVSIFVNPLQFGPHEDLDRYPRTLQQDLERCEAAGAHIVFEPGRQDMYPPDFQTNVELARIGRGWEDDYRPGHLRGVSTVVTKLLSAVGPCIAAFGRKDYQQCRLVAALVRDLWLPVRLIMCPTLRDSDGLAMSSRNRYLSPQQRKRATGIYRGMLAACRCFARGERNVASLRLAARAPICADLDEVQYVELADPETLIPLQGRAPDKALLLVAARIAGTRLIDNVLLGEETLGGPGGCAHQGLAGTGYRRDRS
ncbi:MAG: pantoate--beta-alanine ligase [Proteobacteria bacterium]|nr:pantoate--beta-alanine ligase [Pseudomonadota bacterium]